MGAEHSLCSRIDDFSYDPVAESPAAYVRVVRANLLTNMVATKDVVDTSEMTLDQLRAYYEEGGANRLKSMNADQQQDLFKQFVVSFASFLSPLKVESFFCRTNKTSSGRRPCARPTSPSKRSRQSPSATAPSSRGTSNQNYWASTPAISTTPASTTEASAAAAAGTLL